MLKKLYAVMVFPEGNLKGSNAYIWSSQQEAEKHAEQLVLTNRKDLLVFEMTAKVRLRVAGVYREDLTEAEVVVSKDQSVKKKPVISIPGVNSTLKPGAKRKKDIKKVKPVITPPAVKSKSK